VIVYAKAIAAYEAADIFGGLCDVRFTHESGHSVACLSGCLPPIGQCCVLVVGRLGDRPSALKRSMLATAHAC
jgi:hypothetical protein